MTGLQTRGCWALAIAAGLSAGGVISFAAAPAAPAPVGKPVAAVAPSTAGTPVGRPAPMAAADKSRKTAEVLVAQGLDTLALGDIKGARDLFVDVLQVDSRNRKALEALGYCYIKLDDMPRASRSLEGAVVAPVAPGADAKAGPSRPLAMNLAMSLLRSRNTVRAATMLRDYLAATPSTVDEEALNALAICLDQSSKEAKAATLFKSLTSFYEASNAKLEETKAGQKRWGVEWIDADDYGKKSAANKKIQKQMDDKWAQVKDATADYNEASSKYSVARNAARFRKAPPNMAWLERDYRESGEKVDKLRGEYDKIAEKLQRPTFPKMFAAVPLETPTAIASAAVPAAPEPAAVAVATPVPSRVVKGPPQLSNGEPPPTPASVTPPPAAPDPVPTPPPAPTRRKAFTYAAGFAVSADLMVTSATAVDGTTRISVQPVGSNPIDAEIVKIDAASGLALIRLGGGQLPSVGLADAFAGGPVTCASFPTPAVFDPEAEVITGTAVPPKDGWSIRLAKHPRLSGAPVFSNGKVVGVELAARDSEIGTLPTASLQQLRALLAGAGVPVAVGGGDPKGSVALVSGVK